VGRERFLRLSHNTAGRDLNITSLQCGLEAHPLKCGLRDRVDYNVAKLPECLRCLLVIRSPCNFAHCALPSSMLSLAGFNVVGRNARRRDGASYTTGSR
jgi:hypothetical protein